MKGSPLDQVLVVEGDVAMREHLIQLLESNGYRAIGACSIAETLAHPDLELFKAILLDWKLPDGTADQLLTRISSRAPEVASVVVTGEADLHTSIAALRHVATDYLVKPINPNCLQASLARIEFSRECRSRWFKCEHLASISQAVTSVAHESRNALQCIQAQVDLMELDLADDVER
ncbi:MAG: response regulator [Pirellulaceae bacterium]|nr:response regulator [Pirellulaceae bacterium]